MRAALLQLTSSDDPAANLSALRPMLREAAGQGAGFVLTPEVSNCVSTDRAQQRAVLRLEAEDAFVAGCRAEAAALGIWLLLGSVAVKSEPPETRFANRALLIAPDGTIAARYDKMHMFDVQVSESETYRESAGFAPGSDAVLAPTPFAMLGLSICYDLRFAYLYRALAQAGAEVLCVPSAFSPGTGPDHWQPLLQARAIETGSYVLAPAQCGRHPAQAGRARETYGHSMAIDPWGRVLLDAGTAPGVHCVDLDRAAVAEARRRLPALRHDRPLRGPAS
jgi:predicted amidohydrolase